MLDDAWAPLRVIRLSNPSLDVSILAGVGAKIYDLIHRPSGQNYLWHNPRVLPQPYPVEANFDNYWCGGWDDAFPTCETCTHAGEVYPNLGELRSVSWNIEGLDQDAEHPWVRLSAGGPISPVRAGKLLRLNGETLEMEFTIRHEGYAPLDFIWGTHPAFAIEAGCRLHIPARSGLVSVANPSRLGEPGQSYSWPVVETLHGRADMSLVPEAGNHNAGHYALDLWAGWYAIEYPHRKSGILVEFPLDTCPHLWLWLSYGGWRGHYLAVIEPWTSVPVTLSEACEAGTHRVLRPGESFHAAVKATPWIDGEAGGAGLQALLARRGLTGTQ